MKKANTSATLTYEKPCTKGLIKKKTQRYS